jgi:hypothetical protein
MATAQDVQLKWEVNWNAPSDGFRFGLLAVAGRPLGGREASRPVCVPIGAGRPSGPRPTNRRHSLCREGVSQLTKDRWRLREGGVKRSVDNVRFHIPGHFVFVASKGGGRVGQGVVWLTPGSREHLRSDLQPRHFRQSRLARVWFRPNARRGRPARPPSPRGTTASNCPPSTHFPHGGTSRRCRSMRRGRMDSGVARSEFRVHAASGRWKTGTRAKFNDGLGSGAGRGMVGL